MQRIDMCQSWKWRLERLFVIPIGGKRPDIAVQPQWCHAARLCRDSGFVLGAVVSEALVSFPVRTAILPADPKGKTRGFSCSNITLVSSNV